MKVIRIEATSSNLVVEKINFNNKPLTINEGFVNNVFLCTEHFLKHNKIIISNKVNSKMILTVIYKDYDSFLLLHNILNNINVVFDIKESVPSKVFYFLSNNRRIKYIECYFMPSNYVHFFASHNVTIKFNNDMMFDSEFVRYNGLKNLKDIYYKKIIYFYSLENINNNFETFLKVNKSLKLINDFCYNEESLKYIIEVLDKYKRNNVSIFIRKNSFNNELISNDINKLKKLNKKYKNDKREIKIVYSEDFFKDNLFKILTYNGLKALMIFLLYTGFIFTVASRYYEFKTMQNINRLENELQSTQETVIEEEIDEVDDVVEIPVVETPNEPIVQVDPYANIPSSYDELLSINSGVVGWIKLNNNKINFPVTKYVNNSYYLNHDIFGDHTINGWIFMDYRNDAVNLNKNTIIYGHNLRSGNLFGGMSYTYYKYWYGNPTNQLITFNTLKENHTWKIISIYKIEETSDYLKINFFNEAEFFKYVEMIKSRSIYNFNTPVNADSKILTLSTCSGTNRRLVLHAVLQE